MLERHDEIKSALTKMFKSLTAKKLEELESRGGRVYIDDGKIRISYGRADEDSAHDASIQYLPYTRIDAQNDRFSAEEYRSLLLNYVEDVADSLVQAEEDVAERAEAFSNQVE